MREANASAVATLTLTVSCFVDGYVQLALQSRARQLSQQYPMTMPNYSAHPSELKLPLPCYFSATSFFSHFYRLQLILAK